ncbi:Noc2-domain-containing protein [Coprinopsis marcescibilis]|uniref:Noc2-domain-containing protein n=1 Tax=Coprinopsis marcescibilis TaxID=230819 RepID=A0A5C3LKA4_COPMA|nr:Noc2-domain-containing protein [Coprinopsis marcescibilis]
MGKKATKATRKFASSGQLKKTIQARHKHQQAKKKLEKRRGQAGKRAKGIDVDGDKEQLDEDAEDDGEAPKKKGRMTVDDILNADFLAASGDEEAEDDDEEGLSDDGMSDEDDDDDNASFASVDELEDEDDGKQHLFELSKLAEKDPEFFKYLQENDKELLNFKAEAMADSDSDDDLDMDEGEDDVEMGEEDRVPTLTKEILQKWQKALLEHRSLRALRRLLVAFRSAAHMNEDDQVVAWSIDSPIVYNKLVVTSLRYTPIILEHHVPYKTQANGKFKPPTQTRKLKGLQKLILSFFNNIIHLLDQLTDSDMIALALGESAKLIPYIISSRKTVKQYLKNCLDLWASGKDNVRIAAILAVRRMASSPDEAVMDTILKSTYLTLVRSCKSTSVHTLPSINLMKNSASELFCINHGISYQHAFGYIRQLAIHLRNSTKIKTKEAYKQVYNWQFAHCIDFWSMVLAKACDTKAEAEAGKESELRPLIYPLVQVSLGAVKLVPHGRSHPFHLHILRSLLHLTRHTGTYVPLSTYLVPILAASLAPTSRPKPSSLKPMDFDTTIRVPQQYVKTRVYVEGLVEEAIFLLAEWLSSSPVHGSIAFPEVTVPIVVALRKSLKASTKLGSSKDQSSLKTLLERVDDSCKWIDQRRKNVSFAPGKLSEVTEWERELRSQLESAPLSKYLKVQQKSREARRRLLQKVRVTFWFLCGAIDHTLWCVGFVKRVY